MRREVGDVEASGVRLRVERRGEGEPVLVLHGGLADRDQVFGQLSCLTEAWTLVAYTARGQGESSRDVTDHDLDRYVDDMAAVADAVSDGPLVVGGGSMGAAVALAFAQAHPTRVRGLVLIAPSHGHDGVAPAVGLVAAGGARTVGEHGFEGLREVVGPTLADQWAAMFTPASFVGRCRALASWQPVRDLAAIRAPVLVVAWPDDDQHPLAIAEQLTASLPDATLVTVAAPGRVPDNAAVCAAVRRFLAALQEQDQVGSKP